VKSNTKPMNSIKKKNNNNTVSYKPIYSSVDTNGNKYINSISYNKKNIQISKNGIGKHMGFCVTGLNPHS